MGVCASKQNMKYKERNCLRKHFPRVTPQSEFGIIVIGYIRQLTTYKHCALLTLSSDFACAIKTLCTKYCGFIYGHLTIPIDATLKLKQPDNVYFVYSSISLRENATLTVNRWDRKRANGGLLNIVCQGDIILHEGASIDLNGRGYSGGNHGRNGESYNIHSPPIKSPHNNYGGGGGAQMAINAFGAYSTAGGGGAYGDYGCDATQTDCNYCGTQQHGVGGEIYGDPQISVLYRGSGGGSGYRFAETDNSLRADEGGSGGGALKITCFGKIIMKQGSKICCNGDSGSGMAGGGSGGSIHVVVKNKDCIQMNENSKIEAIGGKTRSYSGNGGNGRIRTQFLSSLSSNSSCTESFVGNIEPKPRII